MGQGSGTVVLIHSSASSGNQWRSLSERVSGRYEVIAPDLCGYGTSEPDRGEYGFVDDCKRVEDVIQEAQSPVHLIGHSYGGLLSAIAALKRPGALRSLTLIEPVCFHLLDEAGDDAAFAEIKQVSESQKEAAGKGDLIGAAEGFVTYWMGSHAWANMPEKRQEIVAGLMPKVAAEWPGAFEPTTRLADYTSLPMSTLLIRAADTTLAARRVVDLLLERVPKQTFVQIERGGHMSPVTNSEPVNAAIDRFLARL